MFSSGKAVQVAVGQVKGLLYPSDAERAAAYELLVELSTRTGAVALAGSDVSIGESLSSFHTMFDITRSILRKHGVESAKGSTGNISLATIAIRVLNDTFRPLLSQWHPLLAEYEAKRPVDRFNAVEWERQWPLAPECRVAIRNTRAIVRSYIDTLGRIAGAPDLAASITATPSSVLFEQQAIQAPIAVPEGIVPKERMARWLRLAEMWRIGPGTIAAAKSWKLLEQTEAADSGTSEPSAVFNVDAKEEFWFDYVSDLGDAFDGTAPVAWLQGRAALQLPDDRSGDLPAPPAVLPRGRLLVFGGDEVYPFAKAGIYESQTELPFTMGYEVLPESPGTGAARSPGARTPDSVFAIPGNHDWLGGIEHFRAMFCAGRAFAERWQTPQTNTYWHIKLPQGWWMWGIDTGLHNELPDVERDYFARAAEELKVGDRVIVCTPVPLWQLRQKEPERYQALRSAIDPLIVGRQATAPLWLSGDSHFFAHFERVDVDRNEDHITAGGGGAFLHPTHGIAERIPLETGNMEFRLTTRWPLPSDSRALAPRPGRLYDRQFWLILVLFGLGHRAFAWLGERSVGRVPWFPDDSRSELLGRAVGPGWSARLGDAMRSTVGSWWALLVLLLLTVGGTALVKANSREPRLSRAARSYGLILGSFLAFSFVAMSALRPYVDNTPSLGLSVAFAVVGGVVSTAVLFGGLTWVNAQIKAADNLVFSAAHLTRFKHFIRFRIDLSGDLTCFVVGVDPVGKGWFKAMTETLLVPPYDPAGIPRIHYVWGKTFHKFSPPQMRIGLSVSNVDHDKALADTVFAKVCEDLVQGGHTLLFCGRPFEGYTRSLAAAARERHADNPNDPHTLINFVLDRYWPEAWKGQTDVLEDGAFFVRANGSGVDADDATSLLADLDALRERLTRESSVRVVFGGDLLPGQPQTRRAPGVLHEAYLAATSGTPLLVVGGFGGVAEKIADAVSGRLDAAEIEQWASHFLPSDPNGGVAGFREMIEYFRAAPSFRNGLSAGENRELLRTRELETVRALVSRAIRRVAAHSLDQ